MALAVWGLSRVPTAFLPIEDQGYFLIAVQLPEGASLERTTRALDEVTKRVREQPGVDKVVAIGGLDAINDSASLANAGIAYVILKDWSERGKREDLLGLYLGLSERVKTLDDGIALVIPPPPIQGIGNVSGATMKVELRDGSFDYAQLEHLAQAIAERASPQSTFQVVRNSFRADAPQLNVDDRQGEVGDARRAARQRTRCAQLLSSARATSASSTSSAACSRSTCRRRPRPACSRSRSRR